MQVCISSVMFLTEIENGSSYSGTAPPLDADCHAGARSHTHAVPRTVGMRHIWALLRHITNLSIEMNYLYVLNSMLKYDRCRMQVLEHARQEVRVRSVDV